MQKRCGSTILYVWLEPTTIFVSIFLGAPTKTQSEEAEENIERPSCLLGSWEQGHQGVSADPEQCPWQHGQTMFAKGGELKIWSWYTIFSGSAFLGAVFTPCQSCPSIQNGIHKGTIFVALGDAAVFTWIASS